MIVANELEQNEMIKRPGRIRNWIITIQTGFIIGILIIFVTAKDYTSDVEFLTVKVVQQQAEIQRLTQLKKPDTTESCVAWWFASSDLVKVRDKLCPKKVKK